MNYLILYVRRPIVKFVLTYMIVVILNEPKPDFIYLFDLIYDNGDRLTDNDADAGHVVIDK